MEPVRITFCTITGLLMFFIGCGYPFIATLRGKGILMSLLTVLICWVGLFLYLLALCFGFPLFVGIFSPTFAHEVCNDWVPSGKAAGAVLCIGWLPPLLA